MQAIYEKLEEVSSENVNLHILIKNKKTNRYDVLTTEPSDNICDNLINSAKKQIGSILERDYEEEEYCPVTTHEDDVIIFVNIEDLPIFEDINNLMEGDPDFYSSDKIDKNTLLWAFIITIGTEDKITMFQKCQPKKLLKSGTGKWIFMVEREDGHFSDFDETILTVDPKMDCVAYNEKMYIFTKGYYEQIFGILEKFEEEIDEKLADISQEEVLVDLDELSNFCKRDKNKEKKLYKILEDGGLELLTEENIRNLNESHNLGLEITEGKIKLTPTKTKQLLKLMNKDCQRDAIENEPYMAISKTPINR